MTLREYAVRGLEHRDYWILTDDVGYGVLDLGYRKLINCGIAEQAMVGMAFGMADREEKVACFTITPHILRAFDFIRLLKNKQNILFIGVGEGLDYDHLGRSHTISEDEMSAICEVLDLPYYCARSKQSVDTALSFNFPRYLQIPNVQL
jgi:transketolase C-terminal domain/subunit